MSNVKDRIKFDRADSQIWKKSNIDEKGRTVLPKKLRRKLGLNANSYILWISAKHNNDKKNEFLLEIGVKR